MDLGHWLRSLGLDRYEAVFREHAIGCDVLRDLSEGDLESSAFHLAIESVSLTQ